MATHALRRTTLGLEPHDSSTAEPIATVDPALAGVRFGARLREQRERRQVSIASIAESTKILPALLDGLENGDVGRWPTGLYRRSFIRAYASGIGLDPETIVREFLQHFPDPEDSATALPPPPPLPPAKPSWASLRLTFPDGVPLGPTALDELRGRSVAVAVDAFAIGVAGVLSYSVLGMLWAPLCIIGALYFFVSVLVLGTTPGVVLFGVQPRGARPAHTPSGVSRLARWLGQRPSPPQ